VEAQEKSENPIAEKRVEPSDEEELDEPRIEPDPPAPGSLWNSIHPLRL
jgi:hypothetical protein